jgi:RHS repeat-associated protein
VTYTYNEVGERTKTEPSSGPATTYGYDQAGNLTSVERPEGESKPEIEDTYAYNGDGLRVSQTISGTTTYMAWDTAEELPLLLSDGTNSYIYGPGGLPIEQVSSGGTTTYLHHDQQGSTRLLTGSAGTVTGKCTYGPYGVPTCEGTATTPLGYDGQYTSSDTGLIYLRARTYDPATGQFLSVDPKMEETRAIYEYAKDDPLADSDPTGLITAHEFAVAFGHKFAAINKKAEKAGIDITTYDNFTSAYYYSELESLSSEAETGSAGRDEKSYEELKYTADHEVSIFGLDLYIELINADSAVDFLKAVTKTAAKVIGV